MPWIGLEPGSTRTPIWPAPDQLVDPHSPSFRFAIKPQFRKCTQVPQFLEFFKLAPTIYMYTWCKLSAFFSSHPPCLLRPSQFLKNQTTIEGAPSPISSPEPHLLENYLEIHPCILISGPRFEETKKRLKRRLGDGQPGPHMHCLGRVQRHNWGASTEGFLKRRGIEDASKNWGSKLCFHIFEPGDRLEGLESKRWLASKGFKVGRLCVTV